VEIKTIILTNDENNNNNAVKKIIGNLNGHLKYLTYRVVKLGYLFEVR